MKKLLALLVAGILVLSLAACGNNAPASNDPSENEPTESTGSTTAPTEQPTESTDGQTAITLTIGDKVLNAYLNDSAPAKSLIAQLPLTVTLNDSDNDFCGGNLDIDYSDSDVTSGYHNGDLAFWTPANNFVIFVDDEENSANTGNLVILGKITESQEVLDSLAGRIDVTIALAQNTNTNVNQNDSVAENENSQDEANTSSSEITNTENTTEGNSAEVSNVKVKITVSNTELIATLDNNATTQALIEKMPMTLPMMDLYGREMCYRYGAYALPTDNIRSDGYEIGDIAYWAPGGSLVILYAQNGEHFERQHLGHIDSGVEVFETTGDVDVTFELMD